MECKNNDSNHQIGSVFEYAGYKKQRKTIRYMEKGLGFGRIMVTKTGES
jgi:hypothetical protein